MPGAPGRPPPTSGEAQGPRRREEDRAATSDDERAGTGALMEAVAHPDNLRSAMQRVQRNKGSAGADGMTVDQLPTWLAQHETTLREQLRAGTFVPQPVRRVTIPKASGGERVLGIPSAVDRLVQQAILQVLQPRLDPTFSPHSYGFRPGRRAHDAIRAAQRYVQQGRVVVVDVDLEAFFDHVNHDVLMSRLARRVADPRLLRVIRRFLAAGIMVHGVVMARDAGTPQGGPLSPLLANVLLDEVDQELAAAGHTFVRYADDLNVYVRSHRAGQRVLQGLVRRFAALRLRVNAAKSAVAFVWERQLLGYTITVVRGVARLRVGTRALARFRDRVRDITRQARSRGMAWAVAELQRYVPGWRQYYQLSDAPSVWSSLDGWLRRRLRALQLRLWVRGTTAYRALRALGLSEQVARLAAAGTRRWWYAAGAWLKVALPNSYFEALGVPRLQT